MPEESILARLPRLPVYEVLPQLRERLTDFSTAILVAPPGAGKTSLAPLAVLDSDWRGSGTILVVEPRRVATKAAAHRMSDLLGEKTGGLIGFRTRLESVVSEETRIICVTEGLLVRRLLSDPTLEGIAGIFFDEVHERSLDLDLALGLALDLQRNLRPELRIVAMSATPDTGLLQKLLDAPIIESEGRAYPVEIRHAQRDIPHLRDLPDAMARRIRSAWAEETGDILAFLPGVGEINRTHALLAGLAADVCILHGEVSPAEQDRILRPGNDVGRRVILATSIAETSLTVPGVRIVIDGGFRRAPKLDPSTGFSKLETMRVSRATATQRAGRAGREAAGIAFRLWTEASGRALTQHDRPEIAEAELSGFILDLAAWQDVMGTDPESVLIADSPPKGSVEAARVLLRSLGALDEAGRVSGLGMAMSKLGAHPRLAAMMLAARDDAERALAADLAALLEERDPIRPRSVGGNRPIIPPVDIALRLELIAGGTHPDADRGALSRIRAASGQYRRRLQTRAEPSGNVGALLAAAFPDRVAQRRGEIGSFRLSGGGGARLGKDDALASASLLAVAQLHVRTAAEIRLAAPLDATELPDSLLARATETVETTLDPVTGSVLARKRLRLGALVLRDQTVPISADQSAELLMQQVVSDPEAALDWTDSARQLRARMQLARDALGRDDIPQIELKSGQIWQDLLQPWVDGLSHMREVKALDLVKILRATMDYQVSSWLDKVLPTHLDLPGGRTEIDYLTPVPTLSSRAQNFYGLKETPRIGEGKIGLQLALLSPAGRPQAITSDIAGFWKGGWADMRRDMRGRYPRHDWPEDPALASPPPRRR